LSSKPKHIAVVGAGLAGCSLALELEKRGWTPILFHDAKRLSSSDVAAGLINPIVPKGVRLTWKWEHMFPTWLDYYQQWESYLGTAFAETLALQQIHRHPDHEKEWSKQAEKSPYQAFIQRLEGPLPASSEAVSGHTIRKAGRLNVQSFCTAVRSHFDQKGGLLESRFESRQITAPVDLPNGVTVSKIVYCQGIEMMDDALWHWLPMHPTGGDILKVQLPLGALPKKAIWKSREWLIPLQGSDHEWLLGSNFHKGNRSQTPIAQDAEALLDRVAEWLGIRPILLEHRRAVRPTVGSRRPYLGNHPLHPHLYVFNGLGSKGSALVSWLAPAMASFISESTALPEEVNVHRYWEENA
jgi:glycine oxidase